MVASTTRRELLGSALLAFREGLSFAGRYDKCIESRQGGMELSMPQTNSLRV